MQMSLQCRCHSNADVTPMQMSLQCRCHSNADVTPMQMSLQCRCHSNADVTPMHKKGDRTDKSTFLHFCPGTMTTHTESINSNLQRVTPMQMSLQCRCHSNADVTPMQMSLQCRCHSNAQKRRPN